MIRQTLLDALTIFLLLVTFSFSLEIIFLRWKHKQPLSEMAARHLRFWSSLTITTATVIGTVAAVMATYSYRLFVFLRDKYRNR